MVVHACRPSTQRQRLTQGDIYEFEASLVNIASPMPARTIYTVKLYIKKTNKQTNEQKHPEQNNQSPKSPLLKFSPKFVPITSLEFPSKQSHAFAYTLIVSAPSPQLPYPCHLQDPRSEKWHLRSAGLALVIL